MKEEKSSPIMPKTPELDKQTEIAKSGKSQAVQCFVEWMLEDLGYRICEITINEDEREAWSPVSVPLRRMMETFFCIDPVKVELEKQEILNWLGSQNG